LIFVLVFRQKPQHLNNFSWDGWLLKSGAAAVLIVTFLQLHYSGVFNPMSGPEDSRLQALAVHLSDTDAKFYGASWCPHCQDQKRVFTASAKRLPYVECSPTGRQGARSTECVMEKIMNYPTWIISGRRYERGVVEPEVLARLSKFDWEAAAP
jgi:thiol-disulfide isomerase/thioredoxin